MYLSVFYSVSVQGHITLSLRHVATALLKVFALFCPWLPLNVHIANNRYSMT